MGAHRRSERPRSLASYGPETGTTYLLHFDRPYRHARHYVGWTQDLVARLEAHARGRGARLVQVAVNAGIGFRLARTWPESTRDREDLIKHAGGARRYCPECGVKPRDQATPQAPARDRRPMWMADRDGQWVDGTPIIYDPDQTWEQARAIRAAMQIPEPDPAGQAELAALDELERRWTSQEEHVNLKDVAGRIAAPVRNRRVAREYQAAQAEADRLWAMADDIDRQQGRRPGYQHELTAERAARIRARLGPDLVQDVRLQAMPRAEGQPLEHWAITPEDAAQAGREAVLQGAELDAEIDRLAGMYAEADEEAEQDAMYEEGEDEAYLAEQPEEALQAPGLEPGDDAAAWSPALEDAAPPTPAQIAAETTAWNAEFDAGHVPDERDGASREEVAAWEQWAWEKGERESAEARADWDRREAAVEAAQNAADPEGEVAVFGDDVQAPGPEPGWDAAAVPPGSAAGSRRRDLEDAVAQERDLHYAHIGRGLQVGVYGGRTPQAAGLTADPAATWADIAADPAALARADEYTEGLRERAARENWPPWQWPGRSQTPAERAAELGIREVDYLAGALAQHGGAPEIEGPGPEPEHDAATWSPALADAAAADDALHAELGQQPEPPADATQGPDIVAGYLRRDLEERATPAEALRRLEARALAREHIAQASHDGAGVAAAREQAGAFRQARLRAQAEAYGTAGALQEDAAQADQERDERGWHADHRGVYVRNPEAEAPGAHRELAGYEADSPDHMYGSPQCAEADPEGAHFGRRPGEPMDTGCWPVLQADYGRMFIPPYEPQAEAG